MKENTLKRLEEYLVQNQNSTKLSLNYYSIEGYVGDEGIQFVMDRLPKSCRELDLSNNNISDKGAQLIVNKLREININNCFGVFVNGVRPLITKINLSGNPIGSEGAQCIEDIMHYNRELLGNESKSTDVSEDGNLFPY